MIPITSIDEIRKIQLNILDYVHYLCEKYKLRYYLAGGTLLGAVRHKGYIPWDDDIDILMPRSDYEKLIYIINHNTNKKFRFLTYLNEKNYLEPFGRVVNMNTYIEFANEIKCKNMGVFIDVFPMDGLNEKLDYYVNKRTLICRTRLKGKFGIFNVIYGKILCHQVNKRARADDFDSQKYIACKVVGLGEREKIEYENFSERILVDFEGRKYYAPIGYEVYLKNLYKDYMKLPPKNQQRRNHMFRTWYR